MDSWGFKGVYYKDDIDLQPEEYLPEWGPKALYIKIKNKEET